MKKTNTLAFYDTFFIDEEKKFYKIDKKLNSVLKKKDLF